MKTEYFDVGVERRSERFPHTSAAIKIERAFPVHIGYRKSGEPFAAYKGIDGNGKRWTFVADAAWVRPGDDAFVLFCDAFAPIRQPAFKLDQWVRVRDDVEVIHGMVGQVVRIESEDVDQTILTYRVRFNRGRHGDLNLWFFDWELERVHACRCGA